jgi:hypothetical protein
MINEKSHKRQFVGREVKSILDEKNVEEGR